MIIDNGYKGKQIKTSEYGMPWLVTQLDKATILACYECLEKFGKQQPIKNAYMVKVVIEYWKDENRFTHNLQVFDEDGNYLENDDKTFDRYVTDEQAKIVEKDLFKLFNSEVKLTETAKELIRCYLTFGNNNLHLKDCGLFVRGKEVQYITRKGDGLLLFYTYMADGSVLASDELEYNDATEILHTLQRLFPI